MLILNPKSSLESTIVSRKLVMPDQINPNGILFGGVLMSWMDKVAYMAAQKHAERVYVVTANIDNIQFLSPLKVGDHALLTATVEYTGTSSMEVAVRVEREDLGTSNRIIVASACLTFVALDKDAKPVSVPALLLSSEAENERYEQARIRVAVRNRVRAYFKRRTAVKDKLLPKNELSH